MVAGAKGLCSRRENVTTEKEKTRASGASMGGFWRLEPLCDACTKFRGVLSGAGVVFVARRSAWSRGGLNQAMYMAQKPGWRRSW